MSRWLRILTLVTSRPPPSAQGLSSSPRVLSLSTERDALRQAQRAYRLAPRASRQENSAGRAGRPPASPAASDLGPVPTAARTLPRRQSEQPQFPWRWLSPTFRRWDPLRRHPAPRR